MPMGSYDMAVYLGKQLLNAASDVTSTHGTVLQLTRKVKVAGANYSRIIILLRLNCFLTYKTEK
jgi:hypothetical protein